MGLMEGKPEADHIKLQINTESIPRLAEIQTISTPATFIFIAGKLSSNSLCVSCFVFNQQQQKQRL